MSAVAQIEKVLGKLDKIHGALADASEWAEHRDRMNAMVHLGEVRWSPLTLRLQSRKALVMEAIGDLYEVRRGILIKEAQTA